MESPTAGAPIVVAGDLHLELLIGGGQFAWHLKVRPDRTIKAVIVPDLAPGEFDDVRKLDRLERPRPSELAAAAFALHKAGMPLTQICQLGRWFSRPADASVLMGLHTVDPILLKKMDRGAVKLGHAHILLPMAAEARAHWTDEVIGHKLSVKALTDALAATRNPATALDSNISHIAEDLENALGTKVEVRWNASTGRSLVEIPWFGAGDLLSSLEAIGRGIPDDAHKLPSERRTLTFEIANNAEFDAVFGHLLAER